MNMNRMKHKGLYIATLLLVGLVVAVMAAAPADKAKKTHAAHAALVTKLDVALKDLSVAEKAVKDGKKDDALESLAKVRVTLTGIRDKAKPAGPALKGWTEDLDKAMKYAAASKRPIVLDFTGSDWCGWCIKLHDEVFSKDAFKDYADKNLVLVAIDFPRNKKLPDDIKERNGKLAAKYGVRGFPTIVILDSTGKKEIGRTGYVQGGPDAFIAKIKQITGK
jgi:protein disulfide-isomerase